MAIDIDNACNSFCHFSELSTIESEKKNYHRTEQRCSRTQRDRTVDNVCVDKKILKVGVQFTATHALAQKNALFHHFAHNFQYSI